MAAECPAADMLTSVMRRGLVLSGPRTVRRPYRVVLVILSEVLWPASHSHAV